MRGLRRCKPFESKRVQGFKGPRDQVKSKKPSDLTEGFFGFKEFITFYFLWERTESRDMQKASTIWPLYLPTGTPL